MIIYEVPDLFEQHLLDNEQAVKSAIHTANIIVSRQQPLLGALLMQMTIVFDDSPAAVSVSVGKEIVLHVNTNFWFFIQSNQALADLLLHEALHISQNHVSRFEPSELVNLATDLAINQFSDLRNSEIVTGTGVTMTNIYQILPGLPDLAPDQSADYYLAKFNATGHGSGADSESSNESTGDTKVEQTNVTDQPKWASEHDAWAESTDEAQQTVVNAVRQAAEMSQADGRGIISSELLTQVLHSGKAFALPTLYQGIANYTNKQLRRKTERTYMRYGTPRAHGVLRRGKRRISSSTVIIDVFIDTSGSIDVETLENVLASLTRFNAARRTPVTYVPHYFDVTVYDYNAGNFIGRGGTIIQSVFDWLKKEGTSKQSDQLIITDGQGETDIRDYGFKPTWLITHDGEINTVIPTTHRVIHTRG